MMRKAIYNAKTKKTTYIEVEGSEIAELEDYTQEPTLEERLEQTEQLLQATTMAFTEFIFSQTKGKQHDYN